MSNISSNLKNMLRFELSVIENSTTQKTQQVAFSFFRCVRENLLWQTMLPFPSTITFKWGDKSQIVSSIQFASLLGTEHSPPNDPCQKLISTNNDTSQQMTENSHLQVKIETLKQLMQNFYSSDIILFNEKHAELLSQFNQNEHPTQELKEVIDWLNLQIDILRYEFAQAAINNGDASYLIENIHHFQIKNPEFREKLAEICAQKSTFGVVKNIQNFKIENPEFREKLAEICANEYPMELGKNIQNFKIENPEFREKLAEICARKDPIGLAHNIQNFKIENSKHLDNLARICCTDPENHVGLLRSTNPESEFFKSIAQQAAQINPLIIRRLQCLPEFDQSFTKELIKVHLPAIQIEAWSGNSDGICILLHEIDSNSAKYMELWKKKVSDIIAQSSACFSGEEKPTIEFIQKIANLLNRSTQQKLLPTIFQKKFQECLLDLSKFSNQRWIAGLYFLTEIIPQWKMPAPGTPDKKDPTQFIINDNENETTRKTDSSTPETQSKTNFPISAVPVPADVSAQQGISSIMQDALYYILDSRDSSIAWKALTKLIFIQLIDPTACAHIKIQPWVAAPLLLSFAYKTAYDLASKAPLACLEEKKYEDILRECLNLKAFKNQEGIAYKSFMRIVLKLENSFLSKTEQLNYLIQVAKTTMEKKGDVHDLVHLHMQHAEQTLMLLRKKDVVSKKFISDILKPKVESTIFQVFLEQKTQNLLELNEIQCQQAMQLLSTTRRPDAWITYAATLLNCSTPEARKAFHNLIVQILNGNYLLDRYLSNESRIHIKKIVTKFPDLWKTWQIAVDLKISDQKPTTVVESPFLQFVTNCDLKGYCKNQDSITLDWLWKQKVLPTLALSPEEEAVRKEWQDLYSYKDWSDLQPKLAEWYVKHKAFVQKFAFHHDLETLLSVPATSKLDIEVVDTDNWEDILLCGTEIEGSCQRIDGDMEASGLLGYFAGHVRLLAVKDRDHRIVARAIIKLLWHNENLAIFVEPIYPQKHSDSQKQAIFNLAKKKAQILGVSAYYKNQKSADKNDQTLSFLGGDKPFEYEDAICSLVTGTKPVTITKATPLP